MSDVTQNFTGPGAPEERLLAQMRMLDSVRVAFSGGVDSALILAAAVRTLPAERVGVAIADPPSLVRSELAIAPQVADRLGIPHVDTGPHADDHRTAPRPGLRAAQELNAVEALA